MDELRTRIVDPVGDDWPAVILALVRNVDFVAAARAVLDGPEFTRRRVEGRRLQVAVADGPDLRPGVLAVQERVARRGTPFRLDVDDLADVVLRVLRLVAQVESVAQRHEEVALAVEDQARAPVIAAGIGRFLTEDHL